MISNLRARFNEQFSDAKYQAFLNDLNQRYNHHVAFRVAETPVFLPNLLRDRLLAASDDVITQILALDIAQTSERAIPAGYKAPNETPHPFFLVLDFAVCHDQAGQLTPQLIELQGVPSLYGYQVMVADLYRQHFDLPDNLTYLFNGLTPQTYTERFKRLLLNGHDPENVVLLEVTPDIQHTSIDFIVTQALTGVVPVCISDVKKRGRQLYYLNKGREVPIKRIYNRIIPEDIVKNPSIIKEYHLTDDVEVEWCGHPNWFFRISKHTMPYLNSPYVPESTFLSQHQQWPENLEQYVLKPLFSYASAGVKFHVTQADLDAIPVSERDDYLLQKKIKYQPVVQAPDGLIKTEIRVLCLWEEGLARPEPVMNLARLSRGDIIGVKFNKDKTWVGGSVGFFEPNA